MIKVVSYTSTGKLACANCTPSDVILCITSELVAQKACVEPVSELISVSVLDDFPYKTIEAVLVNTVKINNGCNPVAYRYAFSYDDDQLVDDADLSEINIIGAFCAGCLKDYINEVAGNEIKVDSDDDGNFIITTQHGCVYTIPLGDAIGGVSSVDVAVQSVNGCTETFQILVNNEVVGEIEQRDHTTYTQAAHGFTLPANGILPMYWDQDTESFQPAQADDIAHIALLLAVGFPDADRILFADAGFYNVIHGLSLHRWYALDPDNAGGVVLASTLDPDYDVYQLLFFPLTTNCILIRLAACGVCGVTETAPPDPDPGPDPEPPPEENLIVSDDMTTSGACAFDPYWGTPIVDTSQYSPNTAETPLVATPTHSGSCAAHYYMKPGEDEKTPITFGKVVNFSEIYLEFWMYPKSNGALPYPWPAQKLARLGDPAGAGHLIPFVTLETAASLEHGSLGCGAFDDNGNELFDHQVYNPFPDDTWTKVGFYVKLNTPGVADGIIKNYINDVNVFDRTDVLLMHAGNLRQFGFYWIMGNYSWGSGAGAPTYPDFPYYSTPSQGGHLYVDDILVLSTKPESLV